MKSRLLLFVASFFSGAAQASGEIYPSQKVGLMLFALSLCVSVVFISISIYKYQKPSKWLKNTNLFLAQSLALTYIGLLILGLGSSFYFHLVVFVVCSTQILFFIRFKS
jgi:hypothetical protein